MISKLCFLGLKGEIQNNDEKETIDSNIDL